MVGRRADVMCRAHRFHGAPGLRFPQYPDYLLFTESTSFHGFLLLFSLSRSPVLSRPLFGGQVNPGVLRKLTPVLNQKLVGN